MADELRQSVIAVVTDPKTALTVGGTTTATGASELFLGIPWPIIVTGTGFVFSVIFGVINVWKFVIDRRIRLLEEKILIHKEHGYPSDDEQ